MRIRPYSFALLALALSVRCSSSSGPSLDGTSFYRVTFDGSTWLPDTATGLFFFTQPDTGTLDLFALKTTGTVTENLALSIHLPLLSHTLVLADTGTVAVGIYNRTDATAPPPPLRPPLFTSTAANPGNLRITTFRPADSVIAGSFSFVASTTPDTSGHHTIAGTFRIHYESQQVFLPLH